MQSTGWPGVVTAVANWFGKSKKGLIFGIWNTNISIGSILGSIIAGVFVESHWGWSFITPGLIIGSAGIINLLFMVPEPEHVGLNENGSEENSVEKVETEDQAISFFGALKIPGVVEFSLCLFFAKLVSYTFLYWLPTIIKESGLIFLNNSGQNSIFQS